ncbi:MULTISPECIES: N-acetylmuramoyl-L-alanine amidase [Hyphobacterium]|uniref:N-acetylmuramoyl-L-alanine amidase n=1 Tax=Hyphobacterium vulgare TaxID=1736751 RepID=A0ABV6ZZM4_9PROT
MTITDLPSPNFNDRKSPVRFVVLHYTGMETGQAAIDRLRDPEAGVSAHYVVEEDGRTLRLVPEDKRAWHAGVGEWCGETDMNSASIGIEIVNGGHDFGLPDYPDPQIAAVIELVQDILERHDLPPAAVIGHSDLAPGRKQDPGERFPWRKLADVGAAIWPFPIDAPSDDVESDLSTIGYGFSAGLPAVVEAFQRRFRPSAVTGKADEETLSLIRAVAEISG